MSENKPSSIDSITTVTEQGEVTTSPANQVVIVEEGIEVQHTKSYGVGIDCHSKFIQISVLVKNDLRIFEYRREFATDWHSLQAARDWIVAVILTFSSPPVDDSKLFHYCIESTSTYHLPVIHAFRGIPSIVNPTIAGATKRKTDVLDAKLLALHDLTGVWAESYIPTMSVQELRLLIAERANYKRTATRVSARINNGVLRFGITAGRDGSVTRSKTVRAIIENQISDSPDTDFGNLCPFGIPEDVRSAFREQYKQYDQCRTLQKEFEGQMLAKAKEMQWETKDGMMVGTDLIDTLTTAPSIGAVTAVIWLANIITPLRFPNSKAIAAYCGLDPSLKISAKKVTSTVKRGGNKDLHGVLCACASVLVKNHSEMFGKWGYNIYKQTGRWKKATNAVARKLAVALYYMNMNRTPFSYDKYNLIKEVDVIDISIDELAVLNRDFKRYTMILKANGISSTSGLVDQYYACKLMDYRGLGKKFYGLVKDFIANQKHYRELYGQKEE